jgi:DNA polymerase delta subunit 1
LEIPHVRHTFVRSDVHRGLLPRILEELLTQRKQAKRDMGAASDPMRRTLLNSLQLALKISANSVYGFTGASKGFMQCRQVAESTTGAGRNIIDFTQIELHKQPGIQVVYGDTDSCFVRIPPERRAQSLGEIFAYGEHLAEQITEAFARTLSVRSHIHLEMEKIIHPLILYDQKKRYAGWSIEDPRRPGKMLARGIELVRKDSIALVRDTQKLVLRSLLEDRDPYRAVAAVRAAVDFILDIKPGDDFGHIKQSKSLRAHYQKEDSLPHFVVNRIKQQREPGSESRVGDRVEYVVIASQSTRIVDKVEDCEYAREQRLPPDWSHYVDVLDTSLSRLLRVPLKHTQPALAAELEACFFAARQRAARQVSLASMARHGTSWVSGHRCKGGGTQLKLAMEGLKPPPPTPKRRRTNTAAACEPPKADIRLFLRKAPAAATPPSSLEH